MNAVERAKAIATEAHQNDTDKAGMPYIGHPARIAARVAGDAQAECVAWLHDAVEDTSVTLDDLQVDFDGAIVEAVDAITRRPDEHSFNYHMRVRANALALKVKLADIADNTDPERLAKLDAATRDRLNRKYKLALTALTTSSGHYGLWSGLNAGGGSWRINVDSGALVFEDSDGNSDWGHAIDAEHCPPWLRHWA